MEENVTPNCPVCDKPLVEELKAPPKIFINMLYKLQVRCEFHNCGCEAALTLGDIKNHRKYCESNPECRKACQNGCGAMLTKIDATTHDCVHFLKSTIEEFKATTDVLRVTIEELKTTLEEVKNKAQFNLQNVLEKQGTEIDSLKLAIEGLQLEHAKYKKQAILAKEEINTNVEHQETKMKETIIYEGVKLKAKIRLLLECPVNSCLMLVELVRLDIRKAKRKIQNANKDKLLSNESANKILNNYKALEQTLKPMSPEMAMDVKNKYGEWISTCKGMCILLV